MRDSLPTRRDVWLAGVLPTLVALLAATFLLVEGPFHDLRLGGDQSAEGLWLVYCLFAFGGAHILGVSPLVDDKSTTGRKILRFGNCAAYLILFPPAFYTAIALVLVPVGTALDYQPERPPPALDEQSLLFQALAHSVPVAVFAAPAIACGGLLALTAGPRWSSLSLRDWKRLLLFYIGGSVIAALVLVALTFYVASDFLRSHSLINPLFDRGRAWPITLMTYAAVVLACAGIWMAALQVYSKSRNVLKSRECWWGLASLAGAAVALVVATQLLAENETPLLGHRAANASPPPNFAYPPEFHGYYFVGPKSALRHQWDRLVLQSDEWKPRFGQRILFDDDIEVGVTTASDQRPPDCRALSATLTVCADLKRFGISGSTADIDAYEYDASLPEAALSYALGARTATPTIEDLQAGPAEQGSKCRLQLVGVPFDHLTTKAWIGCADWLPEARRLKELVARWFAKTPE